MSYQGPMLIKEPELRWPVVMIAAIISGVIALIVAGMHYVAMNQRNLNSYTARQATWTLRTGEAEFEKLRKNILVSHITGRETLYPFNNLTMELTAVVTNRTNRVITALEIRGAILDTKNSIVQQRTIAIVPGQQKLLEVDEAITVRVPLKRMDKHSDRAQTVLEVTGIRFD
jgi:hypothetical protein